MQKYNSDSRFLGFILCEIAALVVVVPLAYLFGDFAFFLVFILWAPGWILWVNIRERWPFGDSDDDQA